MTKATGKGRGGRRAGAGRKPKPTPLPLAALPALELDALADVARSTLLEVMLAPGQQAPRVSAARAVLAEAARRAGKPGKKGQQADAAAKAASGRFAVPAAPPRLVIDNT